MIIKIKNLLDFVLTNKLTVASVGSFLTGIIVFGSVAYINLVHNPNSRRNITLAEGNTTQSIVAGMSTQAEFGQPTPKESLNPTSSSEPVLGTSNPSASSQPTAQQNDNENNEGNKSNNNSSPSTYTPPPSTQPTSTSPSNNPVSTSSNDNEPFQVTTSKEGNKFVVTSNKILTFCYKSETSPSGGLTVSTNDTSNNTSTCEFTFSNEGWRYHIIVKISSGETKEFDGTVDFNQPSQTQNLAFEYSVSETGNNTYIVSVNKELSICYYNETNSEEQPMGKTSSGSIRQAGSDTTCTINRQNPSFSYFYIYLLSVDDDSKWIPVKYPPDASWIGNL